MRCPPRTFAFLLSLRHTPHTIQQKPQRTEERCCIWGSFPPPRLEVHLEAFASSNFKILCINLKQYQKLLKPVSSYFYLIHICHSGLLIGLSYSSIGRLQWSRFRLLFKSICCHLFIHVVHVSKRELLNLLFYKSDFSA